MFSKVDVQFCTPSHLWEFQLLQSLTKLLVILALVILGNIYLVGSHILLLICIYLISASIEDSFIA